MTLCVHVCVWLHVYDYNVICMDVYTKQLMTCFCVVRLPITRLIVL